MEIMNSRTLCNLLNRKFSFSLFLTVSWHGGSENTIRKCRGVAQLGSVSEWGSEGRRFKSSRPDH